MFRLVLPILHSLLGTTTHSFVIITRRTPIYEISVFDGDVMILYKGLVEPIHTQAEFTFLVQDQESGYGTAIPAIVAKAFVDTDDFLLLTWDELVLSGHNRSDIADLIAARDKAEAPAAITATTVSPDRVQLYGSVSTRQEGKFSYLDSTIEKPTEASAVGNLVSISRFLLPSYMIEYMETLEADERTGEQRSIDALGGVCKEMSIVVNETSGQYFDCGQTTGWLAANNAVAAQLRSRG